MKFIANELCASPLEWSSGFPAQSGCGYPNHAGYPEHMTRAEAEEQALRLQAEHPERAIRQFVAREASDGRWEVASVVVPERLRRAPLTPTIDASPRPSPADDPRTGNEQRLPGLPGGL